MADEETGDTGMEPEHDEFDPMAWWAVGKHFKVDRSTVEPLIPTKDLLEADDEEYGDIM